MKIYGADFYFFRSFVICNLLALCAGVLIILVLRILNKKGENINLPVSYPVLLLMFCYFASVAAITIVPLPYSEKFKKSNINLVPLVKTYENLFSPAKKQSRLLAKDVLQNIIGNIIMFMPLGIFLPMADKRFENYKRIFVFAAAGSMLIELAQYLSRYINNYRQVDIDDVILNTLGAILGYYIYKSWMTRKQSFSDEKAEVNDWQKNN